MITPIGLVPCMEEELERAVGGEAMKQLREALLTVHDHISPDP